MPKRVRANKPSGRGRPSANDRIMTIDLHGRTVAEAQELVLAAVNRAVLDDHERIHIVHGLGTGKVTAATHAVLKGLKVVASFRISATNPGMTEVFL